MIARETKLKSAVKSIEKDYDYIFIDCPPSLNVLTINGFLLCADTVLIPIQCEYFVIRGVNTITEYN